MQAQPNYEPLIGDSAGVYSVDLTIELPPMIPGSYTMDFWIGPHAMQTFDRIRQATTFEIVDSPNPARYFPYSAHRGSIVPTSTVTVSLISTEHPPSNLASHPKKAAQ